ncbi:MULTISPECIES: MATE family efflux transporter [unclassified Lactonifactor]|uniref:MATE family efflux transporter n=1 Tax=unclassified Lactonifactor TaxID=2636670 RepID=UPI0015648831|nr:MULTISPECIES: MATE family efflux transporter [unclassified Lactonifactor]
MTKNMTVGDPLKLILAFAIPLFIGNIFQQIYTMADTMIAGYFLGDSAIAAIGSTSSIYSLVMNFAWGLNGGYTILVAREFGSKNHQKFRKVVAAMFLLNLAGGILLTGFALISLRKLMFFLNTPAEIFQQAHLYITIICGGMSTTLLYNMLAGFLRAMGNSRTPLYFLLISSVLNLTLDALFVIVFHWGVGGTALATVIAQLLSGILCGRYIWKFYREYLPHTGDFQFDKSLYAEMLFSGLAMAMMQCIFAIGSVILQRAINGLGDIIITAHTASRRFVDIFMMPLSTISTAASTFISQNWGAGKIERIKVGLKKSIILGLIWSAISMVLVWQFGRLMIIGISGTSDEQVITNAVMNLKINFMFYPPLGILLCLRVAMQAMGQKIAPLFSSSMELLIKVVAAIWIIPIAGYRSASYTEPVTWLVCGSLLVAVYAISYHKNFQNRLAQIKAQYNTKNIVDLGQ